MIAANHPALGMNPHQSGGDWTPIIGPGFRPRVLPPIRSVETTQPIPPAAAPNQISPPPGVEQYHPQPLPPGSDSLPASVPASAGATGSATPASAAPFSLSDWLTEETIWPGYPNGLLAAGGVIALAWLFGGKKRR